MKLNSIVRKIATEVMEQEMVVKCMTEEWKGMCGFPQPGEIFTVLKKTPGWISFYEISDLWLSPTQFKVI